MTEADSTEGGGPRKSDGTLTGSEDDARGILDDLLSDLPGVVYRCRNEPCWASRPTWRS